MGDSANIRGARHPMPLTPAYKDYLWGGERLVSEFGKSTALRPVAESWELSCHPDGLSVVAAGPYKGRALASVLEQHPDWISARHTGIDGRDGAASVFPILIKLIDAKQNLSLQVHPDDEYARVNENSFGKNEAWYVVDCEPGARLTLGFTRPVSGAELAAHIADGTILDVVRTVPVKSGDCFCVPAGLLHAIGGGVLVAEVQQNSNVTYRVFDYNRLGADGRPRPLHIKKAVDVVNSGLGAFNSAEAPLVEQRDGYLSARLAAWRYFTLDRLDIDGEARLYCSDGFHALLALDADFEINWDANGDNSDHSGQYAGGNGGAGLLRRGSTTYIPTGLGAYTVCGSGRVLLTTI